MKQNEIENIEITLLLQAIYERYGYDFRHYARASVERRARYFMSIEQLNSVSEMIPLLLRDEAFFGRLVHHFSITVTELFRDPFVYLALKEKVFPILQTYPFIKIWHAGCATGEEVYSLAILLKESGLYDRATIFCTDFNDEALSTGKQGIYGIEGIKEATLNYQKAGGKGSLSEYYHAKYDSVSIDKSLKRKITFANHNLVSDGVFGEMHLILCRNVMIYFDAVLQNRVLHLFSDSLINGGFLCLGTKESLQFTEVENDFVVFSEKEKIYRKKYIEKT
jgi:chemotaxis protein methyltransferase CheR